MPSRTPRRSVCSLLLSLGALLLLPAPTSAQPAPAGGREAIRALYVTGGGFHDFVAQEAIVPPGLAARTPIAWTIDHTAGKSTDTLIERHRDTAWTQAFDVVVYNMSFSHVVDVDWIERLARAHAESGVHAVILHGATHSYRRSASRAWAELMGAFSMRHDRQRPLAIEVVAADHPIMQGFPDNWTTIDEELYEIERTWPAMTPLAQAYSVESEKRYPVIWTNTHGKARVFVTTLGHNNEMMANPVYLDLVTRGLLWVVGRVAPDSPDGRASGRP
jgi:uncharacterized protein